jgi:hypothetical protein
MVLALRSDSFSRAFHSGSSVFSSTGVGLKSEILSTSCSLDEKRRSMARFSFLLKKISITGSVW